MLDFSKLNTGNTIDTIINPRDLFGALPNKKGYSYERASQSEVWKQWYEKRNESNLVIKMNTGSGKTVVGLTILKSSLNELKGPAIYVVPDNFLVNQVINEAIAIVQPPTDKGKRLKIFYGTQASTRPPTFVIFVNDKELFHFSYERYLVNQIRKEFGLEGTPVRIIVREKLEKEV